MCCDHEDRIGVELAYKTGPLHYLYRQFAIAQCQWNCSVCRLQEILFPVEVGDKSSSLEVLLQKNWFRYDIWLLKNSKRLKHKTKPSGNSRKQKLQNSIQLRKQVSQIVSSSVSEYDWLNNQITSVAREHKKDSMGEEKNKTRKKIQWGEEENCCPKSRDWWSILPWFRTIHSRKCWNFIANYHALLRVLYHISGDRRNLFNYKIKNVKSTL